MKQPKLTPEDKLWLEILLRDEDLSKLEEARLKAELARRGFPARLIAAFLNARASVTRATA